MAVEAVRELDANVKDAAARISELEGQNAELRRAVETLTEAVRRLQKE